MFARRVLLVGNGLINSGLASLGVLPHGHPLEWLSFSPFAVVVVLVYAWTPFITLPIYLAFRSIDVGVLKASGDLGMSRIRTSTRIVLPLAAPGIAAGFQAVAQAFVGGSLSWQHGSVLALFLVIVVLMIALRAAPIIRSGMRTKDAGQKADPDAVLNRSALAGLRIFFALFLVFLYAPTLLLVMFSFNYSTTPTFPLAGFTTKWYSSAFHNNELVHALLSSVEVATATGIFATAIAALMAYPFARDRLRFANLLSSAVLLPLVAWFGAHGS